MRRLSLIALLIGLAGPLAAQTAPSASEVAAYDGLFRAAHEGDVAAIDNDPPVKPSRKRVPLRPEHLKGVMDPMSAFLALRGLKTLQLRVQQQNANAMHIAEFLQAHPKIKTVYYPGLASHPDHPIAETQLSGYGGMLSFEIDGDFDQTKGFMDRLSRIKLATSLGGVTSLANQPITNTHAALSPKDRAKAGISESLVRLSVGIEPVETIIDDLKKALENN